MQDPIDSRTITDDHRAHLNGILERVLHDLTAKYEAGVLAHGGRLWLKRGLLQHAKAEALDQLVYLYVLEDQIRALIDHPDD